MMSGGGFHFGEADLCLRMGESVVGSRVAITRRRFRKRLCSSPSEQAAGGFLPTRT